LLAEKKREFKMKKFVSRFINDESGATAIEYGLIAALIAVALIVVLGLVGTNLTARFQEVATALA
jgi:pilus assembly protein Flp/PilA